eukprot:1336342-Pyramimonas_sp.AAC.1
MFPASRASGQAQAVAIYCDRRVMASARFWMELMFVLSCNAATYAAENIATPECNEAKCWAIVTSRALISTG